MPRTQRWQEVKHGFASGVLSPSAQDQVDTPQWLQGAADIVNFEVMRDGGLAGRPPFVRSEHRFSNPEWSAIVLDGGINADGANGHLERRDGGAIIGFDGVHALKKREPLEAAGSPPAIDTTTTLYEVELDAAVRAVTWHGCRSAITPEPPADPRLRWRTRVSNQWRMNFVCEYSMDGGATWVHPPMTNGMPYSVAADEDEDPFGWGMFVPGQVARDITVPLVGQDPNAAPVAATRVRLRPAVASQANPVSLTVTGISAFTRDGAAERKLWYGRPFRILSWVAGNVPLALVMTLEGVHAYHVDGSVIRTFPDGVPRTSWHFTPRQLRELTWIAYGKSVLLFHRDFPYPLRVRLSEATTLSVRYERLENIPLIDLERRAPDAGLDVAERVFVELPQAQREKAMGGVGGQQQPPISHYTPPASALPDGPAVGRQVLPADVAPIRPEPVVVRRELVVAQLAGDPAAPPRQAVAPAVIGIDTPDMAQELTARWTGTGADSYLAFIRTVASYDGAPPADRWQTIAGVAVTGTGPEYTHTFTGLMGGVEYYIAVQAVAGPDTSVHSPVSAAHAQHPAPAAPGNPTATGSTSIEGSMTFTVDAVANADLYYAQIQLPGETIWRDVGLPQATRSWTFQGQAGSEYMWRARADRVEALDGDWTMPVSVTPPVLAPPVPSSFVATRGFAVDNTAQLGWTKSRGATDYIVRWQLKGSGVPPTEVEVGDVELWTHSNLVTGFTYEYAVKARRTNAADSAYTETMEVIAGLAPWAAETQAPTVTVGTQANQLFVTPAGVRPVGPIGGVLQFRYREQGTETWTENYTGLGGLVAGTTYEVQIRWASRPGYVTELRPHSAWSPSATGTPSALAQISRGIIRGVQDGLTLAAGFTLRSNSFVRGESAFPFGVVYSAGQARFTWAAMTGFVGADRLGLPTSYEIAWAEVTGPVSQGTLSQLSWGSSITVGAVALSPVVGRRNLRISVPTTSTTVAVSGRRYMFRIRALHASFRPSEWTYSSPRLVGLAP